jgi:hypothetical protein
MTARQGGVCLHCGNTTERPIRRGLCDNCYKHSRKPENRDAFDAAYPIIKKPSAAPSRFFTAQGLDLSSADDRFRSRFWAKTDRSGACWVWTKHCTPQGYGQFTVSRGSFRGAHSVSYALTHGIVPVGMHVCHTCDNPPCVRPDHLFLGTAKDNSDDMWSKGRQGTRHPGIERANARLTDDDVRAIRAVSPYFGRTTDLARQYGVSDTTIRKILRREKWRHVA